MEEQTRTLNEKKNECLKLAAGFNKTGYCKPTWDTISCWLETEAGETRIQNCPGYIFGFQPQENATKHCFENATWMSWSNYTECYESPYATATEPFLEAVNDSAIVAFLPIVISTSKTGYSISLVTLIIAFCVLACIRKLWCPRNILHMHLFVSFIMRALVSILKEILFSFDIGLPNNIIMMNGKPYFELLPEQSNWECKLVFSIWQYFIMANYSWILMEGLYLHNLIFLALFSDTSSVKLYILLGWGLPIIFIVPWVICRVLYDDEICWTRNINKWIYALIQGPIAISTIICFILFINIVRVLFKKLRSSICEESRIYQRLAKSTLILMPLFGVHHTIFLGFELRPLGDSKGELIWLFIHQTFSSFQGFFVALLYCFLNGEVRTELNKTLSWWPKRRNTDASDGTVNGMLGSSRFFSASHHRPSCYSSTSCTSLSLGVNSNWAATRRRERDSGCGRGLSSVGAHGSVHGFLAESPPPSSDHITVSYHPSFADVKSHLWQDRRRSKSDFNVADTSMELKPMVR